MKRTPLMKTQTSFSARSAGNVCIRLLTSLTLLAAAVLAPAEELLFEQVAAGGSHTVAIKADGTLWAWGRNQAGQLGDGTTEDQSSPVQVGTATNWLAVAAGHHHTVAVRSDGTLWAWGRNQSGQLGGCHLGQRQEQSGAGGHGHELAGGGGGRLPYDGTAERRHALGVGRQWVWSVGG
jgi:hypothetical protein